MGNLRKMYIYEGRLMYSSIRGLELGEFVQFFDENFVNYEDLLNTVKAVLSNQNEIFIRELSVKLFNNSKYKLKLTFSFVVILEGFNKS